VLGVINDEEEFLEALTQAHHDIKRGTFGESNCTHKRKVEEPKKKLVLAIARSVPR